MLKNADIKKKSVSHATEKVRRQMNAVLNRQPTLRTATHKETRTTRTKDTEGE